ncbi:DUF2752 domain-containing protein [Tamlana fucoidanivorans]|uniref:DUF2752 domain-containing protein n=1 Tax=Allotamlana fucoidanivorans TaxID=2583814 RepID=A0A5C4SF03_9FLAO|nr:DUF2752 domain-containing protein [Tamlana fucoidanivorans]TNJ42160.1 DUF2752 domain-containing protein [Tamlana fucoidanivorans]
MEEYMLPCLNKKLFGWDCFGCGIQRSLALIIKGEFAEAFVMYPAIYTLILLLGLIVFNAFMNLKFGHKLISILAILNAIIIVTNFIYKTFIIH